MGKAQDREAVHPRSFKDFLPTIVKQGGFEIIVAIAYLYTGIGLKGQNMVKLASIAAYLTTQPRPWVLIGEWNAEPSQWKATDWLGRTRAEIWVPEGTEIACMTDQGSLTGLCHRQQDGQRDGNGR